VLFVAWTQLRWGGDLATVIFDDVFMTGMPAWAGVMCWRRAARAGARRRFWRLLGSAQLTFAAGMLWWDYQQLARHIDVPYPSYGDLGFLASIPLSGWALASWPTSPLPARARARVFLDGVVVMSALFFVVWTLALEPIYLTGTESVLAKVVGLAYPAGYAMVLAAGILMVAHAPAEDLRPMVLVSFSLALSTAVNVPYSLMCIRGGYYTGHPIDVLWILGFALAGLAALLPEGPKATPPRHTRWRAMVQVGLPSLPVAVAGGVAVWNLASGRPLGVVSLANGFLILGVLLLRQQLIAGELQRATRTLDEQNRRLALANERISEADREKSRFLANMSHELRTPLNSIIGFAEILSTRKSELDQKQLHFVHNIHASGQHLLGLIDDILDLSKVEAGATELHVERLDPVGLAEGIVAVMKGAAGKRNVQVVLELGERPPEEIGADSVRVKQILYNLLSNAVKFSPPGDKVVLRVERVAAMASPLGIESIRFSVRDRGPGIAREHHALIFEAFKQVSTSGTTAGTGLGLTLVARFVELHRGHVSVESAPGDGATFAVTLPLAQA
jgi:signal transduction histidine kinase